MVAPITGWILNRLRGFKQSGDSYTAHCPVPSHGKGNGDASESLGVKEASDRVLLFCRASCPVDAVCEALGITTAHLFFDHPMPDFLAAPSQPLPFRQNGTARKGRAVLPEPTAIYQYTDGQGNTLAEKGRFELAEIGLNGKPKKTFMWRLPGKREWSGLDEAATGLKISSMALWGAEAVAAAPIQQTVYYCEGEKTVLACAAAGLLAVTNGGCASTKDFGVSLQILRGRKVALWPDNDGPGREYMATVHARIRDLAAAVSIIAVPLPPSGDAVEFFASGGTVAALESGALALTDTSVEYLAADNIRIHVPSAKGSVTFNFEEMEKRPRSLDTHMTITLDGPGFDHTPYRQRINLESHSGRTELRRDLESIYGKDIGWAKLLNTVFSTTIEQFLTFDRSVDAYDVIPLSESELFFHDSLIPLNAVTIMFGDRASGKSYIAESIAFCAAMGEPFLGNLMPQGPILMVDYEDSDRNFRRRIDRIGAGRSMTLLPGVMHYLNLMGMPIADAARAIRKKALEEGIVLTIIDSLGPATGGDPNAADAAMITMQALRSIGCTVLALAHVPKNHAGDQPKDPFGSGFYSNLSRRTWYVERVQEEASDVLDVGLYCKKVNDGQMPRPLALQITFEGRNGPVRLTTQSIANVPELQEKRPVKWQVWDALTHGQTRTIPDLVKIMAPESATAAEEKALAKAIENVLQDTSRFTTVGKWTPPGLGRPLNLWGQVALDT